jgi:CubicO group peptidase (beta-lactamase class C family)
MIRRALRVAATVVAAFAATTVLPRGAQGQVADSAIARLMEEHAVPGLALAIVTAETTVLAGFGSGDPARRRQVNPTTPFRLASTAKVLVAATVVSEAQAGRLDLHADLAGAVDVPFDGPFTGPVTLHDLLTHTAGFDERIIGYGARTSADMRPLGGYLAERMPARGWPVGSVVSYSNHGMSLAAYAAERAAGRPFAEVAETSLFGPLGMTDTRFLTAGEEIPSGAAVPLSCTESGCTELPHLYSNAYPAGLAFSTAADMSRFIEAILGGRDGTAGLEDLLPPRFTHDARIPGMSYGFFNQTHGGRRVLAHSGSVPGYWSLLLVVPEASMGFFFAANGGDEAFGGELRDLILAGTLGEPELPDPPHRRSEDPNSRAGAYELTRYSHDTIERLPQLFHNTIRVRARGDSLLVYAGRRAERYLQVDEGLYRAVGGERLIAFGSRNGQEYMFRASDVYGASLPAAYERHDTLTSPRFLNESVSWLLALPALVMFLAWPVMAGGGAFLRRRGGSEALPFSAVSLFVTLGTATAAALFAWFAMGFVARSSRLFESGEMFFGMPDSLTSMTWIPWVHAALSAALVLAVPSAWKRTWWGTARRVVYSLLAVAFVLQVSFLVTWNYLPMRW